MSRFLYTLLIGLAAPFFCILLIWRGLRDPRQRANLGERFGFGPECAAPSIWVHAVSVGEVQAAAVLVRRLRQRYPQMPLVLTTGTSTGRERAQALFGADVQHTYIPLDLPGAVRRFCERVRPRIVVIFETELWPNLFHECGRRRVPLLLASARISPRSVGRYQLLAGLFRATLSQNVVIATQSEDDAARFRAIGADPARTHVIGNIKFDLTLPPDIAARGRELRQCYASGRPVWVAGSTHGGEEQILLDAQRRIRTVHQDTLLILVPRHPNRFDEVAGWLGRQGVRFARRSQALPVAADSEVLLVDTLGELLQFYAAGDLAFVGGSLVPIGGHNLLEPAVLGLPILTGPYTFNSADIARLLIARGAVQVVREADDLARIACAWLTDADSRQRIAAGGRDCVEENRGALERLLAMIASLLPDAARSG